MFVFGRFVGRVQVELFFLKKQPATGLFAPDSWKGWI